MEIPVPVCKTPKQGASSDGRGWSSNGLGTITNWRSALKSHVILSETERRRPRRILITNDFYEVHHVDYLDEVMIKIQIYLLAT